MADAAARVAVDLGDELLDRALPVADDEGRHPLRGADEAARDDEEAEVVALQKLLDDDLVAELQGVLVGQPQLVLAADVRQHAPAVRCVERLDDDRPAELLGDLDGLVLVAGDLAPGHGHAVVAEELLGQALVARDLDAELAGRRGDRRLDPLLVDARAEHDEGAVVQAEVRDAARRGDLHDRARRGPERPALARPLEPVDRGLEIEVDVEAGAVLDDVERELAGADADALLLHLVDEVVDAGRLRLARPAERDRDADLLLDLDRHVLGDVAEPGPLADALQEPAGRALRAVVLLEARQKLLKLLGEAADVARRAVAEGPEVDPHPDAGAVGPEVRSVQNQRFEKRMPSAIVVWGEDYRMLRVESLA